MILKSKKTKSKYKNTDAWIDAIYRNNKELIDASIETTGKTSKKVVFKRLINDYIEEGLSPTQAVKTLSRTTLFTPEVERFRVNAFSGLRSDKSAMKAFRKAIGWRERIDESKMRYDKENHIYIYDNRVTISFTNSPYGVNIGVI